MAVSLSGPLAPKTSRAPRTRGWRVTAFSGVHSQCHSAPQLLHMTPASCAGCARRRFPRLRRVQHSLLGEPVQQLANRLRPGLALAQICCFELLSAAHHVLCSAAPCSVEPAAVHSAPFSGRGLGELTPRLTRLPLRDRRGQELSAVWSGLSGPACWTAPVIRVRICAGYVVQAQSNTSYALSVNWTDVV